MRKRYKFTGKGQSKWGIISSIIGIAALLLTVGAVAFAYIQSGQAGKYIAVLGFVAMLLAVVGIYCGIRGILEEDTYRLFPRLGCWMNGLLLAAFILIYMTGW